MLFYSFREAARGSVVWRRGIEKRERGSWDGMVLSSYYFKVKKRPILGRMKSYKVDEVHKPPRLGRFQKRQYSENDMQQSLKPTLSRREKRLLLVDFDAHIRCEREQLTSSHVDDLDHHEEYRESVRSSSYVLQKEERCA